MHLTVLHFMLMLFIIFLILTYLCDCQRQYANIQGDTLTIALYAFLIML